MEFTPHKAVISAIGTTLTAAMTAWAAFEVAMSDGVWAMEEYGTVTSAVVLAVSTIYSVWRVPNQAKQGPIMKLGQYPPSTAYPFE